MIDLYDRGAAKFSWWQDWRGECVAIVACGPSAVKAGVEKLRDRIHVVVINESYRLCPWAEILYSCDSKWWEIRESDVASFGGLKITWGKDTDLKKVGIELNKIDIALDKDKNFIYDFVFDEPGVIGSGGNSCFQIMNLVAQFGATGIALIGLDLKSDDGTHWHGDHPHPLRNPDGSRFGEWKKWFERVSVKLRKQGTDVVNCSLKSRLECFPKMNIDDMLKRWSL